MVNLKIYQSATKILTPIASAYVWLRGLKEPSYREGLSERKGFIKKPPESGALWIHAASMGEAKAAIPLVQAIMAQGGRVFLTTATPAGRRVFSNAFEGSEFLAGQAYIPFDSPAAVKRFIDTVNPKVAVLVELELWPNLLTELKNRDVPVVIVSARLSQRSLRRYLRIGPLIRQTAKCISLVGAQTEADAVRFVELGVPSERVKTLGSLKFDQTFDEEQLKIGRRLRLTIGSERPVWVAVSVREGEEQVVVAAHEKVRESYPSALLIIIPRHETQFSSVASCLPDTEDSHVFWSAGNHVPSSVSFLIADVMGQVPVFLAASDAAFVGGSLVPVGGHNPLEPAALGMPVLMGPFVRNFQQIDEMLANASARLRVSDAEELAKALVFLLGDASERRKMGGRAAAVFSAHQGVSNRAASAVNQVLSG